MGVMGTEAVAVERKRGRFGSGAFSWHEAPYRIDFKPIWE